MNNELQAFEHAYDDLKAKYDVLRESHMKLEQDLKEMTAENAILKDSLKEMDSKCLKLSVENQKLKHFRRCIVSETLDPVLSETPSVVINTKSINITFDNHTNNFKEDDAD